MLRLNEMKDNINIIILNIPTSEKITSRIYSITYDMFSCRILDNNNSSLQNYVNRHLYPANVIIYCKKGTSRQLSGNSHSINRGVGKK